MLVLRWGEERVDQFAGSYPTEREIEGRGRWRRNRRRGEGGSEGEWEVEGKVEEE